MFFFLHGLLKIPKNEEKTAENMKKENKNKRFIEMVSKSPKHGNMPKPRYWENIGPNSSTDSPFLLVVGIKTISYVLCSLLVSGYDLENEVHYTRRLVSGHGLKNEVFNFTTQTSGDSNGLSVVDDWNTSIRHET